jgi:hypothetical protein
MDEAPPPEGDPEAMAPTAAAPAGAAAPRRDDRGGRSEQLRGLVRDIRVEAEHAVRALDKVDAALALTKADAKPTGLDAAIAGFDAAMQSHVMVVDQRLSDLRDLFRDVPKLYDAAGDEIAQIANLWNEALAALPKPGATADYCRANNAAAREVLGDIAWHAALVTVPQRVSQHLRLLRVGGQLKFDESFSDELPDAADSLRMLQYLKAHPTAISGIVDVENGVIYAASPSSSRRFGSVGMLLALLLVGIAIIRVATAGFPPFIASNWLFPSDRFADLVGAYVLLLVGAAIHIVIDAIKQQQRSGPGAFLALDDWFLWIHVREVSNAVSIVSLWVVVFLLAVAYPAGIDRLSALFAGYSLDSVLGIAITRFESLASSKVSAVEKAVGG